MARDNPVSTSAPAGGDGQPAGARRARALGPRRELTMILLLGAAGAALVFLVMRPAWAQVRTAVPAPLPASMVHVSGESLVPYADALAIAALATLAAVLATRRLARRIAGGLLAAIGAGLVAAVATGVTAASAVAAAASTSAPGTGTSAGTAAGSVTEGGVQAGSAVPEVAGFQSHAVLTAGAWQGLAILGALAIVAAGLLVAWRAERLPVMSSRYDAPGGAPAPAPTVPASVPAGSPADSASLWESLSRGEDPTAARRGG